MESFKKIARRVFPCISIPDATQGMPASSSTGTDGTGYSTEKKPVAKPKPYGQQQPLATAQPAGTLQIALQNRSNSNNVYAYITGQAIDNGYAPVFVQSDGQSLYYPSSPSQTLSPLQADVAIPLGAPGSTVNAYIPHIAGGRIWFSIGAKLTFYVNPGPGVVEPSVTNSSDANFNISWCFCEFTYNSAQLFANITYVDFASVPVALSLLNSSGQTQTVPGMGPDGFANICSGLQAQAASDGQPWDQLIYSYNGTPLRALSPNNLLVSNGNAFSNYWNSYVQKVWNKFTNEAMTINSQAAAGNIIGNVSGGTLNLGSAGSFSQPSSKDIFSCSTGPFQTGSNAARNAVIPRLAAAFNRSILLNTSSDTFPNGSNPSLYYQDVPTNHYSRIVHAEQKDGRGYAFPYDDVVPDGGSDVAGTLYDGSPQVFTVAVGGN